jgi:hypothetical protein
MNEQITKLNKAVAEYADKHRTLDEKLFNLGVELGRLLEKDKITDYRLPFFVEQEAAKNLAQTKQTLIDKAENILLDIVIKAYKAELKENGAISIDASYNGRRDEQLSDAIVSRYSIKHTGTQQHSVGGDFTLTFLLQGKLQEIFQRHSISQQVEVSVSNSSGDEDENFYEPDEIDSAFRSVNIHQNGRTTHLSVEQLEAFVNDFSKNLLFAVIKGS